MSARILFVTGKGGTGKSFLAGALAHEAMRRGLPALLVRMASSTHAATVARVDQPEERTIDEKRDLEAFLTRVLGLRYIARRLQDSRTFAAVAAAAPGLRDLVTLTAITNEARKRRGVIVVDAPASGHSLPMLTAPRRVRDLAPFGPVAREVGVATGALADPHRFAALLVTTPEELSVTEVLSLHDEVAAAGVAACHVVVNALWPSYVSARDEEKIRRADVSGDAATHLSRRRRQLELVEHLERRVGRCPRIGFAFGTMDAAQGDVSALLDRLDQDAA